MPCLYALACHVLRLYSNKKIEFTARTTKWLCHKTPQASTLIYSKFICMKKEIPIWILRKNLQGAVTPQSLFVQTQTTIN